MSRKTLLPLFNDQGCADFLCTHALSRRELLRVGGLGVFGLGLTDLLASTARAETIKTKAKSCILLFMWGGPSQLDTWDMKPNAPTEVRGPFKPIATNVPGIQISEHFPFLARQAHRYAIIRSMTHDDPAHLSSVHHIMTGHRAPHVKSDADPPSRKDSPHIGSALAKLQPPAKGLPPFVSMPWTVSHPAAPGGNAPGQNAGWLGSGYDPFLVTGDPNAPNFSVAGLNGNGGMPIERLEDRKQLLAQLDAQVATGAISEPLARALDMVGSPAAQRAFDLRREDPCTRDRYGRNIHGQCLLLARRLIEAGVRLVCVNWHQDGQFFWDTHNNNFNGLKDRLMPPADRGFSALLDDLADRGMLDETLLVWVGEFGRKPQISSGSAGREHWPSCYSAVLAGGGIAGGSVYGKSDRLAAHPADNPVSPSDLTATIYHALGISSDTTLSDREGRPITLTEGRAVEGLFD
jgi:hypothetical protein